MKNNEYLTALLVVGLMMVAPEVLASTANTGLPWETPLETLRDSLTGPVALIISILGIFVAGAMLVFGGEIADFVRRILYGVIAIALLIGGSGLVTQLFTQAALV